MPEAGGRASGGKLSACAAGRVTERPLTPQERASASPAPGEATFDVHLNPSACWRNIPTTVWHYRLGGYQVLKKWLSYRGRPILNHPLTHDEVLHLTNMARRIGAILSVTGRDGMKTRTKR